MKMSIAIIAACAGALVFAQAGPAQAQNRGGFIIPVIAVKKDSGKPGQNRAAIVTSRSNIKHQGLAAPGKPTQARQAIVTSRSNIKHQGLAAPGKPTQARQAINTSRSNIKHGAQ
jgi:hypothetical protein